MDRRAQHASAPRLFQPGALIGDRYRVVRLLGFGGMGAVYEAADDGGGDHVAVKVTRAVVGRDDTLVNRFAREAVAAAMLDSPHIVRVLRSDVDQPTGKPFMVMEYVEGEDLQQLLQRLGRIPVDLALRIVAQACLGLAVAHRSGVVHRDVKPANLILATGRDGTHTVKLLDFGIAKLIEAEQLAGSRALTRHGTLMGSPVYMAPEQARGMKAIDQRADLWSVGVVLYRALAGCTPHPENDTVGDMILSICTATPPPLRTLAPWVPAAVAALCERAMSRDPAARFPTAEAMLAAVQTLLPHGYAIETSMLVSQSADPGPKRRARSRSLAAGVIFGVVLAAAAARVASSRAPAHAAVEPAQPPVSAPSAGASPVPEP